MKYIFYSFLSLIILASCKTNKDYLSRSDNDNTLFDAIKTLKKHNTDTTALQALPVLYNLAQQRNLRKINSYSSSRELSRWDKMINAYSTLQEMYNAIVENDAASRVVTPVNYQQTLYDLKHEAAADYYTAATVFLNKPGRADAKQAYNYFKKADKLVPGYEDAKLKMDEAYAHAIVNVVIKPVQDNSYFFNTGWGNYGYNYSNEYFQQTLVRELKGTNSSRYPARFYTDREASRENVQTDWEVTLTLRNMNIPRPQTYTYSRNASQQVEAGRDSSGRIIYKTVYATINISRQSFTANASMEINITDIVTRKNIVYNSFREDYRWQEEHATYTGDSRALSTSDWALINNNYYNEPRKEDILNELYRKLYPQVKNKITNAVDW
ncbi:MAG: hypothetical protein IPO01_05065 [Chitinophagaceae bacterium]|nr:hypothetical protein [Chitinophagaceae bacterium]MBK9484588.1 hypothetical protein [Chitinophagaceae bacterium]MBL0199177.1 hypothetical protein [Chitinophagaceae bacterium]